MRLRLNNSPQFYFMPLLPLYGDLKDDDNYFQLIVDVCDLQSASMVKWNGVVLEPAALFAALRHQPRSVHAVAWEMFFEAGRAHGASVVMDKSLDSVRYADELLRIFPQMRFLNVVRDPRAQVASMNRAIIHDFDSLLNVRTWVEAHGLARARRAGPRPGAHHLTPGRAVVDTTALREATLRSDQARHRAWTNLRREQFQDYCLRRFRADYLDMLRSRFSGAAPDPDMRESAAA